MSQTALAIQNQPQSLAAASPNQTALQPSIVPLDRENLSFFAKMIESAQLVPNVRNESREVTFSRVMAKIVAGSSYGFDPLLSQTCFDVINGKMEMNAAGLGIQFRRSGEFDLQIVKHTVEGCWMNVLRRDQNGKFVVIGELSYTIEDAKRAGLLDGPNAANWKKYPKEMCYARCITRAVKRYNPTCKLPLQSLGNHFAAGSPAFAAAQAPVQTVPQIARTPEPVAVVENADIHETDEPLYPAIESDETDVHEAMAIAMVDEDDVDDEDFELDPLIDLRTIVKDLLGDKFGGDTDEINAFLKGRDIAILAKAPLEKLHKELMAL